MNLDAFATVIAAIAAIDTSAAIAIAVAVKSRTVHYLWIENFDSKN